MSTAPVLGGLLALCVAGVVVRPPLAAYIFLLLNPLVVGIARGDLVPVLRPNELLLVALWSAITLRVLLLMLSGAYREPRFDRLDLALILMASASSLFPMALLLARGQAITSDDILYSIVLWKYYLLYRLFRASILDPAQALCCLYLSMASAALAAVIAFLQVSNLAGVPELLHAYYDQPFTGSSRVLTEKGTSTLASAFGVADLMTMNLVIAIGLILTGDPRRWILMAAAGIFLAGCIVAGEISGYIGLIVAVVTAGFITGRLGRLLSLGALAAAAASALFWRVIQHRLTSFDSPSGIPQSWEGRWDNLQRFFVPDLLSNLGWLTGVRPAPRVPAPEAWRDWVYIESGYVWLLWIGGLPFLIAFFVFVGISMRRLWRVTCERSDAAGVAALASLSFLAVMIVLMTFDPHLTGRGSADLFFPLLALSLTPTGRAAGTCVRSGQPRSAGAGTTATGLSPGHLPEPACRGRT